MATIVYTIQDFENIKWAGATANANASANSSANATTNANVSCTFTLPQETIDLILSLTEQVGSPTYIKTPIFSNNGSVDGVVNGVGSRSDKIAYKKKRRPVEEINPGDWETLRSFQKTEFVKKEGVDKDIDGIRLLINKLTEKTYDKIIEKLFVILDELKDNESYDTECINKIGYAIFNMATSNKFNSNVYAKLSSELQSRYDFMTDIITFNINEFMKMFKDMEFVSPDENYDKFCEMNIINEKRRSMSLFLVNLFKNKVITLDFVFENIKNVQNMLIDEDTMLNHTMVGIVDELAENLYILLTNIPVHTLNTYNGWSTVYNNIVKIKSIDTKQYIGVSSKTKFKHMDILDKLDK